MSHHDIRINSADRLFSKYIRALHNWTCEACGKVCRDETGTTIYFQLEASHYHSRRYWGTRYDPHNVRALCYLCHKRMGGHTREENGEYDLFMKKILGPPEYRNLGIRAESYCEKDQKLAVLYVKALIAESEKR